MASATKKTGSGSGSSKSNTRSSAKPAAKKSTAKKTASKSTAAKKKNTASAKYAKKTSAAAKSSLGRDVTLMLIIFAGVVLMMSALGFGGFVGDTIGGVMFGAMGYMFYAFPVFLLVFAYIATSRTHFVLGRGWKLLSLVLLFLLMCGFLETVCEGTITYSPLMQIYYAASVNHTGGGLIGGAVSKSLTAAFGEAGCLIVMILVLVCCFIELTQRSFFEFLYTIADSLTEMVESSREMYDEREPERELKPRH